MIKKWAANGLKNTDSRFLVPLYYVGTQRTFVPSNVQNVLFLRVLFCYSLI